MMKTFLYSNYGDIPDKMLVEIPCYIIILLAVIGGAFGLVTPPIFLTALSIGFFLLSLMSLEKAIVVSVMLIPFHYNLPYYEEAVKLSFGEAGVLIAFLAHIFKGLSKICLVRDGNIVLKKKLANLYMGITIFICIAFISSYINKISLFSFIFAFKTLIAGLAIFILIVQSRDNVIINRLIITILLVNITIFIMLLSHIFNNITTFDYNAFRYQRGIDMDSGEWILGTSWAPSNYIGSLLALSIPISLFAIKYFQGFHKNVAYVALVFSLCGIILVLSRGALLTAILAMAITLLVVYRERLFRSLFLPIVSLTILIFFMQPIIDSVFQRIATPSESDVISALSRLEQIKAGISTFLSSPVIGTGYLNSVVEMGYYKTAAHNFIIQMLAQVGLLGCFFAIWSANNFIKQVRANMRYCDPNSKILTKVILVTLFVGLFNAFLETLFEGSEFTILFFSVAGLSLLVSTTGYKMLTGLTRHLSGPLCQDNKESSLRG